MKTAHGAIFHNQVAAATNELEVATGETFISAIVGDDGVEQIEKWRTAARAADVHVRIDHDGPARAGALVATERGMPDRDLTVIGEDRATRIGAGIG